jgi:predicted nucleotidyltransferase component of viral defense system
MILNYSQHKNILFKILKDIFFDLEISPYLGFKGGTAALFFYNLDRKSVDLDFDLLDESKKDVVFLKIEEIIKRYGEIKENQKKRFTLLFIASYDTSSQNIKIEINTRDFGSSYEIRDLFGISMRVMTKEDMFAHKLMAMYERVGRANRDIYDVYFFAKQGWPINKRIVEERSNMSFLDFLKKCIVKLEKMNDKYILDGLGDLISESQKDWVRAKLKQETVIYLKMILENER